MSSVKPAELMLREARVATILGSSFGARVVFFKKLAITLTDFAEEFTLERLDDEPVSVRVDESRVSTTPRLIFWLLK